MGMRLEREEERLLEYLEEEERRKNARHGEAEQGERPAASSSGGADEADIQGSCGGSPVKSKAKEEERGVRRSMDECEEFLKKLKTRVEQRAEESRNPGDGMDVDCLGIAREIGAVSFPNI